MKASDQFRYTALRLCHKANDVQNANVRVEYESLAFAYMSIAELVDLVGMDQVPQYFDNVVSNGTCIAAVCTVLGNS
jgi:hypothetical protein